MLVAPTPVIFVPEGHADTALMLTLLGENQPLLRATENARLLLRQFVDTEQGIGQVGNNMERQLKNFGSTRRVIGLIDLDKDFYEKPYLSQFTRVLGGSMTRESHSYALLGHPNHPTHFLIGINPAFEKWLLARLKEMGRGIEDFDLPVNFSELRHYCKKQRAEYDPRLRALLDAIAAANYPAYSALADFVAQMMDAVRP